MNETLVELYRDGNYWSCWYEDTRVYSRWGKVGGELQITMDEPGPRQYKTATLVAQEEWVRRVKEKRDQGYHELGKEVKSFALFVDGLPKVFTPPKPIKGTSVDALKKLIKEKRVSVQRKRDGQRHLAVVMENEEVRLYSRRIEDMTLRFPRLVQHIKNARWPVGTVIDGEIVVEKDGFDDFRAVGTIARSLPERAARMEMAHNVIYVIFDVLYYQLEETWRKPYQYRYDLLHRLALTASRAIQPVTPVVNRDFELMMKAAKDAAWEGYVIWDLDQPTRVEFGGQPKRANCHAWKVKLEGDFIATGWYGGSGRNQGRAGGVNLALKDPSTGRLVPCGKCGTGFNDAEREEIPNWKFPCVVKVEYDKQEDDSMALKFPAFLARHEDKTPDECVLEKESAQKNLFD